MTDHVIDQLRSEVTHWRLAVDGLADLEIIASSAAWEALEGYLQARIRHRLAEVTTSLRSEAAAVARMLDAGNEHRDIRAALLRLRSRYSRAETLLDFYGDAVNSRTNPGLAELLRGYDVIASESMSAVLGRLGIESPLALTYQDKGLGASILRAGIRLWDQSHPSPAAAIKLTRHNLSFPTALFHETSHQVAALCGLNHEVGLRLYEAIEPDSKPLASLVSSWASEMVADVHAVHHAGWAPVAALANVVDGSSSSVFRIRYGDPHPPAFVRTILNVRLCNALFGSGPWDQIESAWLERHAIDDAGSAGLITRDALSAIDRIIQVIVGPMRSLGGASISEILDPNRVSPAGLSDLERQAGESLLSSTYLQRQEPVRVLALLATRGLLEASQAERHRRTLMQWVRSLGRTTRTAREVVHAA